MAHEYHGHREMHVAHRRAKHLMRTGGYAVGGGKHPDVKEDRALISRMLKEHEDKEMEVEGKLRHTRLDKRARGGAVGKFAVGGPIRKITPAKHKPHVNVNVVNIHRGHPRPPLGGLAAAPTGLPAPLPAGGAPLAPPPIAPRRPPIVPMGGAPPMGMKRGGGVKKQMGGVVPVPVRRLGLLPTRALPQRVFKKGGHADGGRIGVMRKGNKAGQATGEHRLEEFKHLGGNPRR